MAFVLDCLTEFTTNWCPSVMFYSGTEYTIGTLYRLDRGNPQRPGILDLFRKPKISWFNFLVGLKAQSTHADN